MHLSQRVGLKRVAPLQDELGTSPFETGGESEVERVSDAIDDIEQDTDVGAIEICSTLWQKEAWHASEMERQELLHKRGLS